MFFRHCMHKHTEKDAEVIIILRLPSIPECLSVQSQHSFEGLKNL